jgi:hypothetical protein
VAPSRTVHGAAERDKATDTTEALQKAPQISELAQGKNRSRLGMGDLGLG